MKQRIENKYFDEERALYNVNEVEVFSCHFEGPKDGESALKESSNVILKDCDFLLRYPLWHANSVIAENIKMAETCRAAIWYSENFNIKNSELHGIKALRECSNIKLQNCHIVSEEFGWKTNDVLIDNCYVEGQYAFFQDKNLVINKLTFKGKYSFQYVENMTVTNSSFDTKDAFWHSKNVTVKDSTIKGEYLAWYSENLTLINCKIIGTQPFCYCENLKLINCEIVDCDLAFEYSSVDADIHGHVISIKNPTSGRIVYDDCDEIILSDSKRPLNCEIVKRL